MKYCDKCKVNIIGERTYCPLCQSEVTTQDNEHDDIFPYVPQEEPKYHLILRILAFISIIASLISVFLNLIVATNIWWSGFIVATFICVWSSMAMAISKRKNILRYLLYQSIVISLFSLFLDWFTDWKGWSITFVIPIICTLAMIVMYILSKVLRLHVGDYMIYLLLDALFGIIPIIFIGTDVVKTDIPSLICIITSIVSVISLIVFEGSKMYSELKRRLHI